MQLSNESILGNAAFFLKLKLLPGTNGSNGEAPHEKKFPLLPGYSNVTKWYVTSGFVNNKKNNRITITIKRIEIAQLMEV